VSRAGVDDLQEIALLAHRRGVQREQAMIDGKIPHQRMIRKSVQRFSDEIMRKQKPRRR